MPGTHAHFVARTLSSGALSVSGTARLATSKSRVVLGRSLLRPPPLFAAPSVVCASFRTPKRWNRLSLSPWSHLLPLRPLSRYARILGRHDSSHYAPLDQLHRAVLTPHRFTGTALNSSALPLSRAKARKTESAVPMLGPSTLTRIQHARYTYVSVAFNCGHL